MKNNRFLSSYAKSFQGRTKLKLIKKASNLSYQLTADGKAIKYKGLKPYENFIKNNSKKNFLLADSTEGIITIK
ncbi:hypothetical protein DKL58_06905 [Lactobacillus kullabergensis]|uniref:Uncharacterized protein n=1 Tax=Lactobacillus kullabergensis TaxID=1218493 RepID=A0ABM6W185_9LACO|nr:hypothetical protein DKL58_06905 [Lactobacillus kullabergensis]